MDSYYAPLTPRPLNYEPAWWPINAAQQAAINSPAQLLLYGGASGGGKSDFLIGDACQEHLLGSFRGLLIRESLGEMNQIADRMQVVYERPLKARWRGRDKAWVFPSGASVRLGYLAHDKHLGRYRGNTYSWLGVDESGLHTEKRIRQLTAWLASVDPRVRVRGRFASNPGGVGSPWQMAVFLRGRCPIHFPASPLDDDRERTSVFPNYIYQGARWHSDGSPVLKTTSFIPADVYANPLYGQDKIDALLSQTAEIRNQLLHGCWCNSEGLYFGFLRPEHVIPYASINDQWWWNHFLSIDYGFGNSAAAAGRYSVAENGRVFKTGLIVEKKMDSVNFAKKIADLWLKKKEGQPEAWRFVSGVIDSANDSHTGTGKSNKEIINEVFAPHGISLINASKDPMGNAQNLYNGLSNQLLVLTDASQTARVKDQPHYSTFQCISTRTVDERLAVKKIKGDPLDDIYDETSYGWNTWIQNTEKPPRIAMADEINAMRNRGMDETSLARNAWRLEQQIRQKESVASKPISMRGNRIGSTRFMKQP